MLNSSVKVISAVDGVRIHMLTEPESVLNAVGSRTRVRSCAERSACGAEDTAYVKSANTLSQMLALLADFSTLPCSGTSAWR